MVSRLAPTLVVVVCALAIGGCQSTVRRLKISLFDEFADAVPAQLARVSIEDMRPASERRPHRGKDIMSCERWFGDDTFVPSRIAYLRKRVADRTRADMAVHIRLERFDVVEYCEFSKPGDATGAATSQAGSTGFKTAAMYGDTVILRLAGDVNGVPFDQSSTFDYGAMYHFPNAPSTSPDYLRQLRGRIDLLIDGVVNKVWDVEVARKDSARN